MDILFIEVHRASVYRIYMVCRNMIDFKEGRGLYIKSKSSLLDELLMIPPFELDKWLSSPWGDAREQ